MGKLSSATGAAYAALIIRQFPTGWRSLAVINLERVDNETFLKAAENYLGFCSGLPYENSDAEQVRAWLSENISTVGRGRDAARLTVGDATFELMGSDQDGSCGARTLLISEAE